MVNWLSTKYNSYWLIAFHQKHVIFATLNVFKMYYVEIYMLYAANSFINRFGYVTADISHFTSSPGAPRYRSGILSQWQYRSLSLSPDSPWFFHFSPVCASLKNTLHLITGWSGEEVAGRAGTVTFDIIAAAWQIRRKLNTPDIRHPNHDSREIRRDKG